MVQGAAKVKIYTEQLQLQKLTLDDMRCMINHSGQGALGSRNSKAVRTESERMCRSVTLPLYHPLTHRQTLILNSSNFIFTISVQITKIVQNSIKKIDIFKMISFSVCL